MVNLGVEDLRDLELRFTIYFNRWRRWLDPVRYGVGYGRFELGDMEDRVNGAHGIWKMERKREGAYLRCRGGLGVAAASGEARSTQGLLEVWQSSQGLGRIEELRRVVVVQSLQD